MAYPYAKRRLAPRTITAAEYARSMPRLVPTIPCPYCDNTVMRLRWQRDSFRVPGRRRPLRVSSPVYVCPRNPNHAFDTLETSNVYLFAVRKRELLAGLDTPRTRRLTDQAMIDWLHGSEDIPEETAE